MIVKKSKRTKPYLRRCKRCHNTYRTTAKCSKICPNCNLQSGGVRWFVEEKGD